MLRWSFERNCKGKGHVGGPAVRWVSYVLEHINERGKAGKKLKKN
jgi:hypothetical protein